MNIISICDSGTCPGMHKFVNLKHFVCIIIVNKRIRLKFIGYPKKQCLVPLLMCINKVLQEICSYTLVPIVAVDGCIPENLLRNTIIVHKCCKLQESGCQGAQLLKADQPCCIHSPLVVICSLYLMLTQK